MKKAVILGSFLLILLPFVLIRTVYPFFRFGMFAEVSTPKSAERFKAEYWEDTSASWREIRAVDTGFSPSVYQQTMRNHYYRQQAPLFLEKLSEVMANQHKRPPAGKWRLVLMGNEQDTVSYPAE